MKVLLTGSSGQLGRIIKITKPSNINLIENSRLNFNLNEHDKCKEFIKRYKPDWVINSAAYTNVDLAEKEEELAYSINALAPKAIAEAVSETNGRLLHISTDYVFNGKQNKPYRTDQQISPIGIYGKSKALGEKYVKEILGIKDRCVILRTSWLSGPIGNNFVLKMLNLHKSKEEISVVSDQLGNPTSTINLAKVCWEIIQNSKSSQTNLKKYPKIMHWSDEGVASWYDIAYELGQLGEKYCLFPKAAEVIPISSKDYKTLASRPPYSVLDCTKTKNILNLERMHWRNALKEIIQHPLFKI